MTRFARSHDSSLLAQARRIVTISAAAFTLGAPAVVAAQTAQPPQPSAPKAAAKDAAAESAFKRADANGDGKLSKTEAAAMASITAKFDELDKDRDGMLSLAEFAAGYSAG